MSEETSDLFRRSLALEATEEAKNRAKTLVDQSKRRQLARDWKIGNMPPRLRANVRRAINEKVRKDKSYADKVRPTRKEDMVLMLREMRSSRLLDYIFEPRTRINGWKRLGDRGKGASNVDQQIKLSQFSFIDRPVETLASLREIAKAEASALKARIDFEDEYCLDVAPFMLLVECWNEMLPVFEGGKMDLPMQKVLAAVGIRYALGVDFQGVDDFNDVWAFPLTRRRGSGSTKSHKRFIDVSTREEATDRFCDALDGWLDEIDLQLTAKGTGWIKQLLGEILENAERHSDGYRRDGSWSVSGFLAKREVNGEQRFVAQLAIVSLGDTFAESLDRASPDQKAQISSYIGNCLKLGARQSEATLRTLVALQDGVTCAAEADFDGRGGTGLMEMLDLVTILGSTSVPMLKPEVTIISGDCCIQLHEPYFQGREMEAESGVRVQWCNSTNSAKVAPDEEFVYDLDKGLPGTVISIRFTLDREYLRRALPDEESNAD